MIAISSRRQKESFNAASTSYNRYDPVDFSTFKSYVKHYRRVAKLSDASSSSTSSGISGSSSGEKLTTSALWKQYCLCNYISQQLNVRPRMPRASSSVGQVLREPDLLLDTSVQSPSSENKLHVEESKTSMAPSSSFTTISSTSTYTSIKASSNNLKKGAKSFFAKSMHRNNKLKPEDVSELQQLGASQSQQQRKKGYNEDITRLHIER